MTTTNLMTEITGKYSQMTKAEKKVADFVLSSTQTALNSTITDLSRLCDVGETSVFRFCRTLELKGYQDFKLSLALSAASPEAARQKETINVIDTDNCRDTAANVLYAYHSALEQTFQTLNFKAIPKVVNTLLTARTINLFGFGGSGTSASEFRNKLIKILPNVIYNTDAHMQLTQAALLGEGDMAVIFSNSGITKDCIEIAKICHSSKVYVVFITQFLKSPAAQYASSLLLCGANEGPLEGGSIAAKTAQLFLIDILYAEVYRLLGDKADENKQKTSQIITEKMM